MGLLKHQGECAMRAWAEIDTESLRYNIREIKKRIEPLQVLGVVKANAYGLGAIPVSKILSEEGISFFGVACVEEAIELQEAGICGEILLLGVLLPEEIAIAEARGIHICVASMEELRWIEKHAAQTKIHIKIDTGMSRLGVSYQEGFSLIEFAKDKALHLCGVFSHFSDADGNSKDAREYTQKQMKHFAEYASLKDIPYRHIFNSGAIIQYSGEKIGNMVRAGISMYGMLGSHCIEGFKNVLTLKTKVLFTKTVEEDSFVSYGRSYTLKRGESYATLAIGYEDGVKRYFSKGAKVEILGVDCPIIGSVCMDMMMLKLPKELVNKVGIGTEVTVFNNRLLEANQIEESCTWDIFTSLGKRVKRVYK